MIIKGFLRYSLYLGDIRSLAAHDLFDCDHSDKTSEEPHTRLCSWWRHWPCCHTAAAQSCWTPWRRPCGGESACPARPGDPPGPRPPPAASQCPGDPRHTPSGEPSNQPRPEEREVIKIRHLILQPSHYQECWCPILGPGDQREPECGQAGLTHAEWGGQARQ